MTNKPYFFRVLFSFLVIASVILTNTSVAFADDGTPPVETTEPTEEPADPPVTETPTPEEQAPVTEEVPSSTLFEQVPADTEVVVLDENGEQIPLASEAALNVILDTDPMWCPAGVMPGDTGCTTNFATISALLTDMRNNTGTYTQDGVIYFTANPGASFSLTTAGASLGSGDFNALNDYNLTLQGGWNGLNGASAAFSGQSNFGSNTLTIGTSSNPWVGNITIKDFAFNNVTSGNAITVYTTSGDITLDNVDVTQQGGNNYTALLDSQSGDITVQNGSTFDGNDSGTSASRNRGFSADTNTGAITISDTTFRDTRNCSPFLFFCIDATANNNGATLSAPVVTLNNVTAFNNDLSGIEINNANSVWLNNVVSYNNGTFVLIAGLGSGVHVNGTGSTVVNVSGGSLTNNQAYGLSVFSGSISAASDPVCTGNRYAGPHTSQCYSVAPLDTTPPVLSLPANITAEASGPSGAAVTYSATASDTVSGAVTVTCSPASGTTFPLGPTTVNCSASDARGNTANGSFTVTVQDTTMPVLTIPANITTEATGASGAPVAFTATASDTVSGAVTVTCTPASGTTFPLGTTTVNCSAPDARGNTANGSFTVTVQDTTAPVILPHSDMVIITKVLKEPGVNYTPPATSDTVDGSGFATCTPAPGSSFQLGITVVTCTATDAHGNNAVPVTFRIIVDYELKVTNTGSSLGSGTGLIALDCFTTLNVSGTKVVFHNLCDHQAMLKVVESDALPGQLPDGATFLKGLNIEILSGTDLLGELPSGSGIQMDFPIAAGTQDQFAVLVWDEENKLWLDVTQSMKDEDLATMLSTDAEDELYQILPTETTQALYRILTTEKTGTFVIVEK